MFPSPLTICFIYAIRGDSPDLTEDFFKTSSKEQALTIAHEYAHKVGMNHKVGFSAALVERDRLKVVYMSPFDPEREEALKKNIDELYFLEVLLAQEW
ncbi:hypothetical protein [Rheinheimera sp.]|uniref:hypothetical protein n=1 Tax=Rheinheimera sp. TaxID=1869214 RepID=UPI00404831D7